MPIKNIQTVFFSPTRTTQKAIEVLSKQLSTNLSCPVIANDITPLSKRNKIYQFSESDLVVVGVPVYAGRVPNVILKFLNTLQGGNSLAIAVVMFGNRNFDDALIELRDILNSCHFRTIAAGAFIGEHSFSNTLAVGRPDKKDVEKIIDFAQAISTKITNSNYSTDFAIEGTPYPYSGYFQPQTSEHKSFDIRKVKPITTSDCNKCGICINVCPMDSINPDNPAEVSGICIKCGACIKRCPQQAKVFNDENYLFHKHDIEQRCGNYRAEPRVFI